MGKLDYSEFLSVASNDVSRTLALRDTSFSIVLTALSMVQNRHLWKDGVNDLTDVQWDNIEAIIDEAHWDIMDTFLVGSLYWSIVDLPLNVLPLDGATYDAADFPLLYEKLPSAWKTTNDFTLPNWQGRFPLIPSGGHAFGDTGGEEAHTLLENEMPAHSHVYTPPTLNIDIEGAGVPDLLAAGVGIPTNTSSAGGGLAHNNMPPFVVMNVGVIAW